LKTITINCFSFRSLTLALAMMCDVSNHGVM